MYLYIEFYLQHYEIPRPSSCYLPCEIDFDLIVALVLSLLLGVWVWLIESQLYFPIRQILGQVRRRRSCLDFQSDILATVRRRRNFD